MTTEEHVRMMIRAYNDGDREGWRARLAGDFVYRELCTGREVHGPDAGTEACFSWREAWPDLHGSIERLAIADGLAVWETVWRGHQTGPLTLPDGTVVPPSGAATEVPACMVITVHDGGTAEICHYFDALGFMIAIGAIPVPAAAG